MKSIYLFMSFFMVIHFQANAQNLVNSEKDTLQQFEIFYYATLKSQKEFKQILPVGLYVLIFDVGMNLEKLKCNINRLNDAPIIYQRHNGYFSFAVRKSSVGHFVFDYEGKLQSSGSFAHLYRVAPKLIGSPSPAFTLKSINGDDIEKDGLLGHVTLFLLWSPRGKIDRACYQLLNEVAADYPEVSFVALSDVPPSQIKMFQEKNPDSHFLFANDKFRKLGKWTNISSGLGSTILIVNQKGLLEYKNRVSEDHSIFQKQLKDNIQDKLNSLM